MVYLIETILDSRKTWITEMTVSRAETALDIQLHYEYHQGIPTRVTDFSQCDCCGAFTTRLHHTNVYGTDTAACDHCICYDYEAYDEPPARFL